jgi:hypothetical protein
MGCVFFFELSTWLLLVLLFVPDWGVCWLLAVFSVRNLSRQSTTLVGPMEDPALPA